MLETMKGACVEVGSISASWNQEQENLVLSDVSFKVEKVMDVRYSDKMMANSIFLLFTC